MASRTRVSCIIEPSCGKTYSNITSERKHRTQHNHASDFKCGSGCDAHFVTYDAVRKHELKHMSKHRCREQGCSKEYPSLENLYRHMREKHPAYRCQTCGAGYTSAGWMKKHEAACLIPQNRAAPSHASRVTISTAVTMQPTSLPKETISGNDHMASSVVHGSRDVSSPTTYTSRQEFLEVLSQPPGASNAGAPDLALPSYSASYAGMNTFPSLPTIPVSQQSPANIEWEHYSPEMPSEASTSSMWPFQSFESWAEL